MTMLYEKLYEKYGGDGDIDSMIKDVDALEEEVHKVLVSDEQARVAGQLSDRLAYADLDQSGKRPKYNF